MVKAASHKHPHNDLCDERPFGDSFFVLRSIFLSLRSRCASAYTFSALSFSLFLFPISHIMQYASLFLVVHSSYCTLILCHLFFYPHLRIHLSSSHASSVLISLQFAKEFLVVYFFSGDTPRPAGELVLIFD